jgi:hypothetical protein
LIEHGRKIRASLVENKNNRYALSLISGGITSLCYGDPYRAMELSSEALRWFSEENKRGQGLAYIIQGQSQRYIGSSWKYKRPEDQYRSREYLEKSLASLHEAEAIFNNIINEPSRLQDTYNEIGCTYRELSQLEAANCNENDAIKMIDMAHEMLQKSLVIARNNNYEIAYIDGCEDLARLYKNYAELDPIRSKDWTEKALGMLKEAEGIIENKPDYYIIRKNKPGKGMEWENPVEEFWQHLGKIHILRGHLIFDDGNKSGGYFQKRSRKILVSSLENYILAMGYFGRFLRSAEDGVSERLTTNSLLMNHRCFSKELYERLRLLDSATMKEVNEEVLPRIIAEYNLEIVWTDWHYKDIMELITQIDAS